MGRGLTPLDPRSRVDGSSTRAAPPRAARGVLNHRSDHAGPRRVRGRQFLLDHGFARRRLSAYVDRELHGGERERVERHLDECPECARTAESLERLVSGLALLSRHPPSLLTDGVFEALRTRVTRGEAARQH